MEFYQILILIIAGAVAIRISLKFDLNKYLENRRKIKIDQLKNICPHGRIIKDGERFGFESFLVSPAGMFDYICHQCNATLGREHGDRINKNHVQNPTLVLKKQEEFSKRVKRLGLA